MLTSPLRDPVRSVTASSINVTRDAARFDGDFFALYKNKQTEWDCQKQICGQGVWIGQCSLLNANRPDAADAN